MAALERLSDGRLVTVIVRLLMDRRGRLKYGELVDNRGLAFGRFTRWRALCHAARGLAITLSEEGEEREP